MEDEEMLETTNETENVDTQTTEENEDLELTDSTETEEVDEESEDNSQDDNQPNEDEGKQNSKSLNELLAENPALQAEFNERMQSRLKRQKDKLTREYTNKYSRIEDLLTAGVGGKSVEENTKLLENMFKEQGIDVPDNKPRYSREEVEILANHEADSIIKAGYDETVEELNRLLKIGYEKMTDRDKVIYKKLAEAKKTEDDKKAIRSLGINEDILNDKEFKDFEKEFDIPANMPFTKKYQLFQKIQNKNKDTSNVGRPGSMKNNDSKVEKDTFTPEEVDMLRPEDYDDPKIMAKVRRSMSSWK